MSLCYPKVTPIYTIQNNRVLYIFSNLSRLSSIHDLPAGRHGHYHVPRVMGFGKLRPAAALHGSTTVVPPGVMRCLQVRPLVASAALTTSFSPLCCILHGYESLTD